MVVRNASTTHSRREGAQYWSAKLVCRLEPDATTFNTRLFKREGSCIAKKSWNEHSSHSDEDVVATRTCSSKTLASCGSSNGSNLADLLTRALVRLKMDDSVKKLARQYLMRKRLTRNPRKPISPEQSSLQSTRMVR